MRLDDEWIELKKTENSNKKNNLNTFIRRTANIYKLECFYTALSVLTGLILIFFDKRPARPDFTAHWERAKQISNGIWLSLPNPNGSGNYGGIDEHGTFIEFNNTAINSPFVYFPSIFGGGHLRISAALTLFFSIILVISALRLSGTYKYIIFSIAILPTFFLSIIWPTADAVSNAFSLLFIAFVLYLFNKEKLSWNDILWCSILTGLLGLVKITFAAFSLLLLLPFFKSKKLNNKFDWKIAVPLIPLLVTTSLWSSAIKHIPPSAVVTLEGFSQAKENIFTHPLDLLKTFVLTLFFPLDATGDKYDTGRNIQFFTASEDSQLPASVMLPALFAIAILWICKNKKIAGQHFGSTRIVISLTLIVIYALSITGLITSWGNIALGKYAAGIQSRYFTTALTLLPLLLPQLDIDLEDNAITRKTVFALILWTYIGLLLAHLIVLK